MQEREFVVPFIYINSLDDPRLAAYRDLTTSKMAARQGLFIAEGRLLVRRLLESDYSTHSILLDERRVAELGVSVPESVPVYVTPNGMVERIIGFNFHRGVIGAGVRRAAPSLGDLLQLEDSRWMVVVCDEVQDPTNLGTILRTCTAFGATAVILGSKCPDPFSRRVLRVSMGAALELPILPSEDPFPLLHDLRRRYQAELIATVLDREAEPLREAQVPPRLALVLGSEGFGLHPRWREFSDRCVTIPMDPRVDSLNVAVACGIFLHHFAPLRNSTQGGV
jgi:tRNA G18 (ribose-2'-O)-methylase SpoU